MDTANIAALLRATVVPEQCERAEAQLTQISSTIGFTPNLLQIIVSQEIDLPVRMAAAIFLKNTILRHWHSRDSTHRQEQTFSLHEQDRVIIRNSIIESTFQATPPSISKHIATCINSIVRHDFPERWPQIVDKINLYLQSPDTIQWTGSLLALYQLVKNFEYSYRGSLLQAMKVILPTLYQLMVNIVQDMSNESLVVQKQIIKIYFALVQYGLPLDLITKEMFGQWMEILRIEADKPAPEYPSNMEDLDKYDLPLWKLKKWTFRTLYRLFYRFGRPGIVSDLYKEFADWYLTTFSCGILEVMLRVLNQYRNKCYVSFRVMHYTLSYVTHGVSHSHSWKFLKPHMATIIQDVIFPIMSHTDDNDEMFTNDAKTYLRLKSDMYDDFLMPLPAAKNLLVHCCKKRKDLLSQTMQFCLFVVSEGANNYNVRQKDGALHMVGSLADVLLNKNIYKDMIEEMLIKHVLPEFTSSYPHMRARACWVLHSFAGAKIKSEQLLQETMRLIVDALLKDTSLPVKFEAAIGLQSFLTEEPSVERYIIQQINPITLELLNLLRLTENDDLTSVIQKLLCSFAPQLMPVAIDITEHLANSFRLVFEIHPSCDDRAITSMALLNTIDTVMTLMMENEEIMRGLQPKVLFVIGHIFQSGVTDFYEEAFSLIYNLTSKSISPELWSVLGEIDVIFHRSGQEYFIDMMPALHNYITVDTPAFLSNENHVFAIFNMCRVVLTDSNLGEDPECHAAKLLEVIILQCKGRIDQAIPCFVSLSLSRLTRDIKTSELRVMCLQVVIAALYYDPELLLNVMRELTLDVPSGSIITHFIKQWITDSDCFLGIHDRKLSIIGFCTLLNLDPSHRVILGDTIPKIMPAIILLFDGLKKAYSSREALEEEVESEGLDEGDRLDEYEVLSTDEDDMENKMKEKLPVPPPTNAMNTIVPTDPEDDDYDEDYSGIDATPLESYGTILDKIDCPIDEYILFHDVLAKLSMSTDQFYVALMEGITKDDEAILRSIMATANERRHLPPTAPKAGAPVFDYLAS